ncbi:hypothetical protein ABGB18_31755 [Nonomuraea sp. B12E4]|uniref:hypothetical protein n=1 Tax=Nonomuraea sp. B12E4 TaxID=3153564 RepID=UPI00325DD913
MSTMPSAGGLWTTAALVIRPGRASPGGGEPWVVVANRQVSVEPINERLVIPLA